MDEDLLQGDHSVLLTELYTTADLLSPKKDSSHNLSDETYIFLKQKLTDANATISSFAQRESNLSNEVELLKRGKYDCASQLSALRTELQTQRAKNLAAEQKADNETRQRFLLQDRVSALETELNEQKTKVGFSDGKVKELSSSLKASENFTRQVYKLATDSCEQSKALKEQVSLLEEMLSTCKTTISNLQEEKSNIISEHEYIKSEYYKLENVFQEALGEIDLMKEESIKQENYINDTLTRFKEIGIHFNNMKTQFLQQHKRLEEYHQEMKEKYSVETEMKNEAEVKLKHFDQQHQKSVIREVEMRNKIEKLEETLNAIVGIRYELEEKNKSSEGIIDDLREEVNQLRQESISLSSTIAMERMQMDEAKNQLQKETEERQSLQIRNETFQEQLKKCEINFVNSQNDNKEKESMTSQLEHNISKLEETIRILSLQKENLLEENSQLLNTVQNREEEIRAFIEDGNNIENCLKQRYYEFTRLQENHTSLQKEKEGLQQKNDSFKADVDVLRRSNTDKEKVCAEMEDKLKQCQMLFLENEEKAGTLTTRLNLLSSERKNSEAMIKKLNDQINELNNALTESHDNIETRTTEVVEIRQQLQISINDKENMRHKLTENLKNITTIMEEEERKLKLECEEKDNMIESFKEKLSEYQDLLHSQKLQIDKYSERINLLTTKNENMSDEISRLVEQNKTVENNLHTTLVKDENLKNEVLQLSLKSKDVERLLDDQKNAFQTYKDKVCSYDEIWESERTQAIKELQNVLRKVHTAPRNSRQLTLLCDDLDGDSHFQLN